MGPSILNLANLIKMPSGCGEQNMLKFVPNIMILNYLKVSRYIIFVNIYNYMQYTVREIHLKLLRRTQIN